MPSPLPLPSRTTDVSGLLEFATRLFKHSLSSCLPLAIAAVLASEAAGLYWQATGHKLDLTLSRDATFWWLTVGGTLLSLWLSGALIIRQRSLCAGKVGSIRNDLRAAGQRWSTVAIASLLAVLLTVAGTMVLILPGIYIGVCMSALLPVALFETLTPVQTLQRSFQLIKPLWVKVFASWLIALMILLVTLFALGLVVALIVTPFAGAGRAGAAFSTTAQLAMLSAAQVFICALCFTLYSAANSSA